MKKNQSSKRGFTLIEIMIVVAIIGLLAAIAIPNFVHARTTAQQANACINNLRQIDGAKQQWAPESKQPSTFACTDPTPPSNLIWAVAALAASRPARLDSSNNSFATSYTMP